MNEPIEYLLLHIYPSIIMLNIYNIIHIFDYTYTESLSYIINRN